MKRCGISSNQAHLSMISPLVLTLIIILLLFLCNKFLYVWVLCRLNEEMIETLFVVNTPNSNSKEATRRSVLPSPNQENRVLDPKKSQNISILLRAINVTIEEICEALLEGNDLEFSLGFCTMNSVPNVVILADQFQFLYVHIMTI